MNNARFLILSRIPSKSLPSRLLSMTARRIRADRWRVYGYEPVPLETFAHRSGATHARESVLPAPRSPLPGGTGFPNVYDPDQAFV